MNDDQKKETSEYGRSIADEKKQAEPSLKQMLLHNAVICACIVAVMIVVFRTAFMLCYIPSSSMYDTLHIDDLVIGTRFNKTDIHRYDIMVFRPPDNPNTYYIKRVIGLPGETILVKKGNVYASGKKLRSSFVRSMNDTSGDGVYKVPKGHYFMMGDNRDNSNDSRFWIHKYVPLSNFTCKAQCIIYPFARAKFLKRK